MSEPNDHEQCLWELSHEGHQHLPKDKPVNPKYVRWCKGKDPEINSDWVEVDDGPLKFSIEVLVCNECGAMIPPTTSWLQKENTRVQKHIDFHRRVNSR